MRIFLIGMPLSGKSTIGRHISEHFNCPFYDLDEEIMKKEKQSIEEIFLNNSEHYFREQESKLFFELTKRIEENAIVALGGGTPIYNDLSNIKGLIIYLEVSKETILKRSSIGPKRPILSKILDESIYKERLKIYEKYACIKVNNDSSINNTLNEIYEEVNKYENINN